MTSIPKKVGEGTIDSAGKLSKEEKRERRNAFFELIAEAGVPKQGLEDIWNYLYPPKKGRRQAGEIAARSLELKEYDYRAAAKNISLLLAQLRTDFSTDDEAWEGFILYISGEFGKYNKRIRREFLSLLGSEGMRDMFSRDLVKFTSNKNFLKEKYEEVYRSWYISFQDGLRKEMDKNLFQQDLRRPQKSYHFNSLPLEFVHPRDLVELDLPDPKTSSGYRFPLSGF